MNIFIKACNYANRLDYMEALMQAVEEKGVKVRVLGSDVAWVCLENNIAISVLEDEPAARGVSETWNNGSLTEFNAGLEDSQAVEDYQRFFNYYWDRAKTKN